MSASRPQHTYAPAMARHAMTRTAAHALAAATLGVALVACGDGDTDAEVLVEDPAATSTASSAAAPEGSDSGLPACAEIWVAGQDLPQKYAGCDEGGTEVAADEQMCSYGLPIVTYADTYYAVPGAVVNEVPALSSSQQYQRALKNCQA